MDNFNSENQFNESKLNENQNDSSKFDSISNEQNRQIPYYTETRSKNPKKRFGFGQLILVAALSSVIGGATVAMSLTALNGFAQPIANSFFSKMIPGYASKYQVSQQSQLPQVFKKVEIEQSESPVSAIAEKSGPSIVGIRVTVPTKGYSFFGEQLGGSGSSEGSGIIISKDGYIMTNNHVIESAVQVGTTGKKSVNGAKIEVVFSDKKTLPATIVGTDTRTDLAVIKVDARDLPIAELGNSDELKVGEMAVAIGNPGGLEFAGSVTVGVISGLNRTIDLENGTKMKLIQTDAAINPGNSGGALLNSRGQIIGINTLKMASSGYEGLGFAIPINQAKGIIDSLVQNGYVTGRPQIGITTDARYTEDLAKRNGWPVGVYVKDVADGSAAASAGIQPADVITKFAGQSVKNITELNDVKDKYKAGDKVEVEINRNGETKTISLTLSEDKGLK